MGKAAEQQALEQAYHLCYVGEKSFITLADIFACLLDLNLKPSKLSGL
jgi:hypothetical protein